MYGIVKSWGFAPIFRLPPEVKSLRAQRRISLGRPIFNLFLSIIAPIFIDANRFSDYTAVIVKMGKRLLSVIFLVDIYLF